MQQPVAPGFFAAGFFAPDLEAPVGPRRFGGSVSGIRIEAAPGERPSERRPGTGRGPMVKWCRGPMVKWCTKVIGQRRLEQYGSQRRLECYGLDRPRHFHQCEQPDTGGADEENRVGEPATRNNSGFPGGVLAAPTRTARVGSGGKPWVGVGRSRHDGLSIPDDRETCQECLLHKPCQAAQTVPSCLTLPTAGNTAKLSRDEARRSAPSDGPDRSDYAIAQIGNSGHFVP